MERSMYGYLFTLLDDDKVEHAKHYTNKIRRRWPADRLSVPLRVNLTL